MASTQLRMGAGLDASYPLGFACPGADLAIEGLTQFQDHQRHILSAVFQVGAVRGFGLVPQQADVHGDAGGAKLLDPAATDPGVGIFHGADNPDDTGLDDGTAARRRAAMVGAGLQSDVECCPPRPVAGLFQRVALGVRPA